MALESPSRSQDDYHVRMYQPTDRDGFLELYETVFGRQRSDHWVQWRHGGPYTDRVRMVVAERDGEIVGAEPFISLPVRAGDTDVLGLQPADVMVHPDHQRNGLMTRMTQFAVEQYAGREGLFFNFPNEVARAVHLRLGWRDIGRTAIAYRITSPSTFVDELDLPPSTDRVASVCYDAYDSLVGGAASTLRRSSPEIRRFEDVPATVLETLYDRQRPDLVHLPRTAEFYRWRLANPEWDVTTYVAESEGDSVAALITCTESKDGVTYTKLLDSVPMVDPDPFALERLVFTALSEHRSADAIAVAEDTLPRAVRATTGFLRNDGLPLSVVTSSNPVLARPFSLGRGSWSVGERRFEDLHDWELSLLDQDTSV